METQPSELVESVEALGFDAFFDDQLQPKDRRRGPVGRIIEAFRKSYIVHTGDQVVQAVPRGSMYHRASGREELPTVGDWVVLDKIDDAHSRARVWRVLDRRSVLIRKAAGETTKPQVIAANIDTIFIVTSFNQDFNLRRLERYLALVRESGAEPVIVVNKADLVGETQETLTAVDEIAPDVVRVAASMVDDSGLDALHALLRPGQTIALIGSSGVGKSTMINRLCGYDRQVTGEIRETDGRGRHTTTTRQLIVLPAGSLMIDTPGMRELHLWQGEEGIARSFEDIEEVGARCKFRDCMHHDEVGCQVNVAVEAGELSAQRLAAWHKLQDELLEQRERQIELERLRQRRASAGRRWRGKKP